MGFYGMDTLGQTNITMEHHHAIFTGKLTISTGTCSIAIVKPPEGTHIYGNLQVGIELQSMMGVVNQLITEWSPLSTNGRIVWFWEFAATVYNLSMFGDVHVISNSDFDVCHILVQDAWNNNAGCIECRSYLIWNPKSVWQRNSINTYLSAYSIILPNWLCW